MGKTTHGLTKALTAPADVRASRIVTLGSVDGTCAEATGSGSALIGVSSDTDTDGGGRADIHMVGNIAEVVYGGTITRGDDLTSDSQGRAIRAVRGAAVVHIIGKAEVSGVSGDIGTVIIGLGQLAPTA